MFELILTQHSLFLACMCNPDGSENNLCNVDTGHCYCKRSIEGDNCDKCIEGNFGFPNCQGTFSLSLG